MEYYKTIKLRINANKSDMKRLSDCNLESAFVWNECIKKNLEMYNDKKKLLNKKELQDFVKDLHCDNICASNKQIVSQKVFEAFRSISLARKAGRTDLRYPYKQKKFFQTEWSYQFMRFMYDSNSILLTTARYIDKDGNARNGKQIKLKFKATLPQNIKTLKLIYEHGHYYACISYIVEVEEKKSYFDNKASIDLGEIHAITTTDNNQNQLIITGRKIRSIKQFRNKKQAELRSKMDKCKKGSRKWKRYKRAWQYIRSKTRRQLDYCVHKLTRIYTNWAVEKGISTVYCGDVTGIEVGSKKGTNVNQKLSQWEYGKIMNLLEYKLGLEGIQFKKVDESYSSQICPVCGFKNKTNTRNYKCNNCEEEFHRDIVGAWNILNRNYRLDNIPTKQIKYLRIV